MPYERPSMTQVESRYDALNAAWDSSQSWEQQSAVIREWNEFRMDLETCENLVVVRFHLDTQDERYREEQSFFDQEGPTFQALKLGFIRRVLRSSHRPRLEEEFGRQAFALWERFAASFDPKISDEKRKAAALVTQYSERLAGVRISFEGEKRNLAGMRPFLVDARREVRAAATEAVDSALGAIQDSLDGIFDELVGLRHGMAEKMGHETFVPLGYSELFRTDYTAEDVSVFRAQVLEHVVPLATRIRQRRAELLGYREPLLHDEEVADAEGPTLPKGDHDWMMARASELFADLGEDFGRFFETMKQADLLDLKSRDGKAGGGFCITLDRYDVPFIYANFNGTKDDVVVFTHECGHAFQTWACRPQPLSDYHFPTYEAAEIHSMSLEMLTLDEMDRFFGDDAARFKRAHLEGAILFIPYGTLVDHFQHWVYENPEASSEERAAKWLELEQLYLPHRRYGDTPYYASGRIWQRQRHIYCDPFYYIDYCLALTCALQFWELDQNDHEDAMKRYRELCSKGGSEPFLCLVSGAGLVSPFSADALPSVCAKVAKAIGMEN